MTEEFNEVNIEFVSKIKSLVGDEFFEHYYLINAINEVLEGNLESFEAYYIFNDNNSWIIGIRISGNYLIYGKNWDNNLIDQTISKINFPIFQPNYHFSGTSSLVTEILESSNRKLEIFKDRIFYSCSKLNSFNEKVEFQKLLCSKNDTEELAEMVCEYFEDEYKGKNNKDFDAVLQQVEYQIANNKLWNLKHNGKIKSICSIIQTSIGNPIIGSFYTKRSERNLGYGTELIRAVTKDLLEVTNEVWLISDKESLESNKVFNNIGYKPVYKTTDVLIK
jgi:predicted GNAT family acetyltransferase